MRIREAIAEDWDTYKALRLRALEESPDAYRRTLTEVLEFDETEWREQFLASVAADDRTSFVAETDEPVGLTFARMVGDQLHVAAMWVAPEARGNGLGKALLDASMAWGRVRGASSARLAVTIGNETGEKLYARAGFEPTGETEPLREGSELVCAWLERPI